MLRLVSIVGIAIAMVIGFAALSSKMKDDYTVRSHIVDVLKQMTALAGEELQCQATNNTVPEVDITTDSELTPLIDSPVTTKEDSSTVGQPITEDSVNDGSQARAEEQVAGDADPETITIERKTDNVKTMGYKILDSGDIEVIAIFNNIAGESGKTHVKSGSRVVISCTCNLQALSCKTVESNINKNYLPKSLTKQ